MARWSKGNLSVRYSMWKCSSFQRVIHFSMHLEMHACGEPFSTKEHGHRSYILFETEIKRFSRLWIRDKELYYGTPVAIKTVQIDECFQLCQNWNLPTTEIHNWTDDCLQSWTWFISWIIIFILISGFYHHIWSRSRLKQIIWIKSNPDDWDNKSMLKIHTEYL